MNYIDTLTRARIIQKGTEEYWLTFFFFVSGSGYTWSHGELVYLTDDLSISAEVRAEQYSKFLAKYGLNEENYSSRFIPSLSRDSSILSIPDDVTTSWAEAACKALRLARLKLIRDREDRRVLEVARRVIVRIGCDRKQYHWIVNLYPEKPKKKHNGEVDIVYGDVQRFGVVY